MIQAINLNSQTVDCSNLEIEHYVHISHTRKKSNPNMDSVAASIEYSNFDMVLLGGDVAANTSEDDSTMSHLDSILDFGNPTTLWALGNHDYTSLPRIQRYTNRPAYYSYHKDGITFIVLDTQDDFSKINGDQLTFFNAVTDTLEESSHLVLLHHKLIWMNDSSFLQSKIDSVANGVLGDCFYCINPNNFYTDIYPVLKSIKEKGIEVLCVGGDVGFKVTEYEYTTLEGINFLASGIDVNDPENKAIIFEHDVVNKTLKWNFELITELSTIPDSVAPTINNVFVIPDSVHKDGKITITMNVEETGSGIGDVLMSFQDMEKANSRVSSTQIEEWIELGDNIYSYEFALDNKLTEGIWELSSIVVKDKAQNTQCINDDIDLMGSFVVTKVSDRLESEILQVFPIPCSTLLNYSSSLNVKTIVVYDNLGEIKSAFSPRNNNSEISLLNENDGIYLIKFVLENEQVLFKKILLVK